MILKQYSIFTLELDSFSIQTKKTEPYIILKCCIIMKSIIMESYITIMSN